MRELPVTLQALYVYPVKSCAGVAVDQAWLTGTGLEFDRCWMVVDEQGRALTRQRADRLLQLQPTLRHSDLRLRAPGMLALHLALDAVEGACRVQVWDHSVPACDMGDLAAQWFSDYLGRPARLVRFDPDAAPADAPPGFANAAALMLASSAGLRLLERRRSEQPAELPPPAAFRPNLVIDGLDDPTGTPALERLVFDTPDGPVLLEPLGPSRCGQWPRPAPGEPARGLGLNLRIVEGLDRRLAVGASGRALLQA